MASPNGAIVDDDVERNQDPTEEELAAPNSSPSRQNSTTSYGSSDRDLKLAELEKERKESLIKAWEESKKSKAETKAEKKICEVQIWEHRKRAAVDERIAAIQKEAEEKRGVIKATKEKEILEVEEMAAKFRASGLVPKSTRKIFF